MATAVPPHASCDGQPERQAIGSRISRTSESLAVPPKAPVTVRVSVTAWQQSHAEGDVYLVFGFVASSKNPSPPEAVQR